MYKRVLLLLDLEGVNNVKGVEYEGLVKDSDEWKIAREQGVLEVNAAADALFDAGVESVDLWDNHGSGCNIDTSLLDARIKVILPDLKKPRLSFVKDKYDCVCYFGYHAMEGTLGGVLAHTMSSKTVQHYKINGKYVGEIDIDAYIAAEYGIPCVFYAAGDIACAQAKRSLEHIVCVETKREISRNEAEFRDNDGLFKEIGEKIIQSLDVPAIVKKLEYPALFEKSFKRIEDAAKYFCKLKGLGLDCYYPDDEILGKDAHTVITTVNDVLEFTRCI